LLGNRKTVIVIPAYNEEKTIARTIDLIRETKIKADIIVVNDGSTDRTASIAKEKGCFVVNMPQNVGKAHAFLAGIKEALKLKPQAVITLDADMVRVPKKALRKMIALASKATRKRKIVMVVAPVYEPQLRLPIEKISGMRAFSTPALYRLLSSKFKSIPRGYGLEYFLEHFFEGKKILLSKRYAFEAMRAFRRRGVVSKQKEDRELTLKRIRKRMKRR
jgi:glycosyltransferase involved in cell wall biosynthesis